MALVEGGKQRAISVDYPVYYSPGACLDILNGFMADAGDPALGGGGRRRGGSGEAPAPPLGHPGQRPEPPRGRGHGTHRGGLGAGWGEPASRTPIPHPHPAPPSRSRSAGPSRALPTAVFTPGPKSLGKRGWGCGRSFQEHETLPGAAAPRGQRDTDTPAGRAPAVAGALGPRSAIS